MAGAVLVAGFLAVVVECRLLFSQFLTGISQGLSCTTLGLTIGLCALIPYRRGRVVQSGGGPGKRE